MPSPNFGARRGAALPELIVLHYTAMASCEAARKRLCLPEAEVSAHWLIGADGATEMLVAEEMRAWHAGAGQWRGCGDVNSRSIGIELDNLGDRPFPEAQMAALETLLRAIMERWTIAPQSVIGHSDMAPGRKIDPGPRFDWQRLARQRLSVWPQPGPAPDATPETFCALAQSFGYPDLGLDLLLPAFRLRFRPRASGPLDAQDMALIADLAMRYGEDGGAWRAS
ncbi:N-acetylmuramoyl-L-alanine amidase [Thioclava dalianensis]|uniref:N-acetylmuramoyl-L-alanine amidase n=1 Tax=Thioclava dalianensis TaxID=1185766 RepID=A0A074TJE4_9RHOB|nr:N-acetylmuramoyl-L-alanine amidase [Thioclava dalianensis]